MKRELRRGRRIFASVGLVAGLLAGPVHAQYQNSNQQGGFGQSSFGGGFGGGGQGGLGGGGGYGGGGFGNSGFGQSGFGTSGFGQSAFGSGGFGSSGFGTSGFGNAQGGFGQANTGGFGQQGVGPGGRNFVGRDAAEVGNNFQQQVGGQQGGLQGFNDVVQNLNDLRDQRRRGREQQDAPPPVKVQLRPAFDLPVTSIAEVQAGAQTRINRTLEVRGSLPVSLSMAEGRTVLTGVVASEHDRALIAQMAALEPGVGSIENRLTVAPQEPPIQPPSAPAGSSQEEALPTNNPQ
jgi:hypothetical protein